MLWAATLISVGGLVSALATGAELPPPPPPAAAKPTAVTPATIAPVESPAPATAAVVAAVDAAAVVVAAAAAPAPASTAAAAASACAHKVEETPKDADAALCFAESSAASTIVETAGCTTSSFSACSGTLAATDCACRASSGVCTTGCMASLLMGCSCLTRLISLREALTGFDAFFI